MAFWWPIAAYPEVRHQTVGSINQLQITKRSTWRRKSIMVNEIASLVTCNLLYFIVDIIYVFILLIAFEWASE